MKNHFKILLKSDKTLGEAYLGRSETFYPKIPRESILGPVRFVTVYQKSNVLEDGKEVIYELL